MEETDLHEVQDIARRQGMTVSEWVRQAIRVARRAESTGDPARKLEAIEAATRHRFPTADIEDMLAETQRGYVDENAE